METGTGWTSLPEEIIVHVLWFCKTREVLRVRLLNKSHKQLVDSASRLQLLIELDRDGISPTFVDYHAPMGALLEHHIQSRKLWTTLPLNSPVIHPPSGSEFEIYEFGGGLITYCVPGEHQDTIRFQSYQTPDSEPPFNQILLAFKCFELSCDPSQDLLVVIQNCIPNYPAHLLSMSTGEYHTRAHVKVLESLVRHWGILYDISTCINGDVIVFTYSETRLRNTFICITVVNWVSGKTLYSSNLYSSCHATLLSARYMMLVHCGPSVRWPGPRLELYDLQSGPMATPQTLLLPQFKPQSVYSFESSYFLHGSNNGIEVDRGDGLIRTGATDIIALFMKARPENGGRSGRMVVMISRNRLIHLASSITSSNSVFLFSRWSDNGRYTRWLDVGEGKMQLLSQKGIYGSRCVCLANPQDLGVVWAVDGSPSNVCILDFNLDSFMHENASRRKHIVRSIQRMDSITKELAEELRDGLEFGLVWGKEPSVATWEDVYLDKDHIVARVPYGFQVHRVTPQFQPRAT